MTTHDAEPDDWSRYRYYRTARGRLRDDGYRVSWFDPAEGEWTVLFEYKHADRSDVAAQVVERLLTLGALAEEPPTGTERIVEK